MKANIKGKQIFDMNDIWTSLLEKAPDPGRLFRMKVTARNMFIGFADEKKNVYAFNFATGGYFPLEVIIEELQSKQEITIDKAKIEYAHLKDNLVNSIPGHLRLISEMEAILNGGLKETISQ